MKKTLHLEHGYIRLRCSKDVFSSSPFRAIYDYEARLSKQSKPKPVVNNDWRGVGKRKKLIK